MSFQNRLSSTANYISRKNIAQPYPPEIGIELSSHCNLRCTMCSHKTMKREKGNISFELFKKIIDECKGKTEFVYLHGIGESLMHPQLVQLINYASEQGLTTYLSTNATLLDEKKAKEILSSKLDFIVLCLDGGVKETYESIRVGGNFDTVVGNIKRLLRLKLETNASLHVSLQLILMEKNWHEKDSFLDNFDETEWKAVNDVRIKPFWDNFVRAEQTVKHVRPCFYLWNMMSVYWDGRVPLCCIDYDHEFGLGDLNTQTIFEVWNGPRMSRVREAHIRHDLKGLPMCATCSIPNQKYFSTPNVLASTLMSRRMLRKCVAKFEKLIMNTSSRKRA